MKTIPVSKIIVGFIAITLAYKVLALAEKKFSDGEIATILVITNQNEINSAKLATKNSKNAEIHRFASNMIKDHASNKGSSLLIVESSNIQMHETSKSDQIKQDGTEKITKLDKLKDKDFDKAYIQEQLITYQKILRDLDHQLIPSSTDKKLKALLQETKELTLQHNEMAKKVNEML